MGPEFDPLRHDAEARPRRGRGTSRPASERERACQRPIRSRARRAARSGATSSRELALARGASASRRPPRPPRPRRHALDPHLSPEHAPVKRHRGARVLGEIAALAAARVGEEHEAAVVDLLQEHHPHRRPPRAIRGRERHCVRLRHARPPRRCEPTPKARDRIARRSGTLFPLARHDRPRYQAPYQTAARRSGRRPHDPIGHASSRKRAPRRATEEIDRDREDVARAPGRPRGGDDVLATRRDAAREVHRDRRSTPARIEPLDGPRRRTPGRVDQRRDRPSCTRPVWSASALCQGRTATTWFSAKRAEAIRRRPENGEPLKRAEASRASASGLMPLVSLPVVRPIGPRTGARRVRWSHARRYEAMRDRLARITDDGHVGENDLPPAPGHHGDGRDRFGARRGHEVERKIDHRDLGPLEAPGGFNQLTSASTLPSTSWVSPERTAAAPAMWTSEAITPRAESRCGFAFSSR